MRHAGDGRDLIQHEILGARTASPAAHAGRIRRNPGIPGARQRDAALVSRAGSSPRQDGRIAGMESGGDIGRRTPTEQSRCRAPMVYAPKDSPTSALRSTRRADGRTTGGGIVQNKRAPRICGALLLTGLAPPAFTAPCRNQTGDLPRYIASGMPANFLKVGGVSAARVMLRTRLCRVRYSSVDQLAGRGWSS